MKHLLLAVAPLLSALAGHAQSNPGSWCPPGATWTYSYSLFTTRGTVTVQYARDTLVAGQPAQLLKSRLEAYDTMFPGIPPSTYPLAGIITRTTADVVEVRANGQFYTLYDFAAQPGASWLTPRVVPQGPCPSELVRVVVDSVGRQPVGSRSLRWLRVHLTSPTGPAVIGNWYGRLYEQVGGLHYMQPQSPTCGGTDPGYIYALLSYRATGQPTVAPGAAGQLLATATARPTAASFAAYPNPGAGHLTLELPGAVSPAATLRLLDLTGRTVRQLPLSTSRQFDVSDLPAGTYTLLLESAGQPALAHRLVVE